jgi:uncharacterized RDD family membrane protein YckC
MDEILDSSIQQPVERHVMYGGFWPRFGALFLDGLILGLPTITLSYFNVVTWKSSALLILISFISIVYKPFMEFQYGATFGKMALNLRVVGHDFQKPTFTEIFLRNIFNIASGVFSLASSVIIFNSMNFQSLTGYMEFNTLITNQRGSSIFQGSYFLILLIEFICLVSDKQRRALHDRIGKTYVIVKTPENS